VKTNVRTTPFPTIFGNIEWLLKNTNKRKFEKSVGSTDVWSFLWAIT